jgi:tetratricopeptide (TPR) repeat protein
MDIKWMRRWKSILIGMRLIGIIVISVCAFSASAQDPRTLEFIRQQEQRQRADVLRQLDSGVYLMDQGKHVLADEKFRYVLQNLRSVPSDLTFYFGKNSYLLGQYKQSIDWLNKYIQLKGTTGQFYQEATEWLSKAQADYLKEKSDAADRTQELLSKNYDIDCGPTGKVTCPVCQGNHVIVRKGPFGDSFKTCPYCNEHGILTCAEYNKLLRGELEPK